MANPGIGHNRPSLPIAKSDKIIKALMRAHQGKPVPYPGPMSNLRLVVTSPNKAAWVFRYARGKRPDGKPDRHDIGLGPYPVVTVAMAQNAVLAAKRALFAGEDPFADKRAQPSDMTFRQAAEGMQRAKGGDPEKPWSTKHASDVAGKLRDYAYPVLGSMPVGSIKRADVLKVLEPIWRDKRKTARDVRMYIEAALNYAKGREALTGDNVATWRGGLEDVLGDNKIDAEHLPFMPLADVPALMAKLTDADADLCLGFTILTVPRKSSAVFATWDQFDLAHKLWTVPRTKNDDPHDVPLSDAAIALLGQPGRPGERVFNCREEHPLQRLQELAPHDPMPTVHGVRRAFGNWGDGQSISRVLLERALAHKEKGVVKQSYYDDPLIEQRRDVMERWAKAVMP